MAKNRKMGTQKMKKVFLIVKKIRRVCCLLFGAAADYQVYYVGSQFIFLS